MKLIFIRHGEPDYNIDSLTENGWKEAEFLSERVKNWNVTQFYVSPLGRAKDTAKPTLEKTNREAITLDYLREYSYPITDKVTGRNGVAWDFVPSDWTSHDYMFELGDSFTNFPCIEENPKLKVEYSNIINNFDELLNSYGYIRQDKYYKNINAKERFIACTVNEENKVQNMGIIDDNEPTLVFFCHLGVTCVILSHLLNIPFECLTHGFFIPTSSITVLSSEERWANEAYFRIQTLGDTKHLADNHWPVSPAGSFSNPFQG